VSAMAEVVRIGEVDNCSQISVEEANNIKGKEC
jgi:hypothetical protein